MLHRLKHAKTKIRKGKKKKTYKKRLKTEILYEKKSLTLNIPNYVIDKRPNKYAKTDINVFVHQTMDCYSSAL